MVNKIIKIKDFWDVTPFSLIVLYQRFGRTCYSRHQVREYSVKTPETVFLMNLILMDPCIVDDSVEIPTRCSFVIEFIIPKFIEGSTCFERHTAHHQEF